MEPLAHQYGYFGVFLISLIGALSILLPIPYTIIIWGLGTFLDPFLIAIAGGLGSALGEISGYILGYYGRAIISEERQRKIDFMLKIFNRYGAVTIFLFALTPLPDDLLFIPLGIMRYEFLRAFVPSVLGKVLMCFILAMGGRLSITLIEDLFGDGGWLGVIAATVVLIVIIAVTLKLDWEKIFTEYVERRTKHNG
ncbi:MAG: YqaA family protein [Candidatus Bathyarchaeia archaeon]